MKYRWARKGETEMGSRGRFFKALFGALALLGFIWFLFVVGILESGGTRTTTARNGRPAGSLEHMEVIIAREKPAESSDLNYMSNRRVPNGPDPIHNRRAGNSGQPPRQALANRP
uniref:Putative CLAVATA3/ESR (CLE)-related protein 25 n=1 Tax=Davidia involucrata TaxID=16924 RepID=A0A5B6YXE7_DAVIN